MLCPSCKENRNKVLDSRLTEGGLAIRRRRICLACNRRFTTKERVEEELRLMVTKASEQRVPYNRDKIMAGVERASYKLDVSEEQLQNLLNQVEEELFANHERDVTTSEIGFYVGRCLRRLHPVAYVRFMSVHRKYKSVDEFIEEIREFQEQVAHDMPGQPSLFDK